MTDPNTLQAAINLWGEWLYARWGPDPPCVMALDMIGHRDWYLDGRDGRDWYITQECDGYGQSLGQQSTARLITGWAHDELVRRGYCTKVTDCSAGGDHGPPCKVYLLGDDILKYDGPTLLHAYLAAIKATEPPRVGQTC